MNKIILQINCKDKSGIIASVTNFIAKNNGNIIYIDQYVDRELDIAYVSHTYTIKDLISKGRDLEK